MRTYVLAAAMVLTLPNVSAAEVPHAKATAHPATATAKAHGLKATPKKITFPAVTLPVFTNVPTRCNEGQIIMRRASTGQKTAVLVCVAEKSTVQGKCLEGGFVTHHYCAKTEADCDGRYLGPILNPFTQCGGGIWGSGGNTAWCESQSQECFAYEQQTQVKTKWVTLYEAAK